MQLYQEEVEEMRKQGVLNEVSVAFSRCENLPKVSSSFFFPCIVVNEPSSEIRTGFHVEEV